MRVPEPVESVEVSDEERAASARFFRWALPLAALIALAVGALWWSITLRQESAPLAHLRDGGRELVIETSGQPRDFVPLPPAFQLAVAQTVRTAKLPDVTADQPPGLQEWERAARGSHLLLGIAKARSGFIEDAAREFRALAAENPTSPLALRLLEEAQARPAITR